MRRRRRGELSHSRRPEPLGQRAAEPIQVRVELVAGRENEADKGRRRLQRPRQVLGMVLHAHVVRVAAELHHLHAVAVLGLAGEDHALLLELGHILGIHLVAVSMSLIHRVHVAVKHS